MALTQAKFDYDAFPNIAINASFYNQLKDIKKTVIDQGHIYTREEAKEKYPLGVMAIRNFDGYNGFDYKDVLVDIAYGISLYPTMPE